MSLLKHSREIELAWAAGFFDGEGCVGYYDRVIRIGIHQAHSGVLKRFKAAIGEIGNIYGPYKNETKGIYSFATTSYVDGQSILKQLWPYLSRVKRLQAKTALCAYRSDNVTRKLTLTQIRGIKKELLKNKKRALIAMKYSVSVATISHIATGYSHANVEVA